MQKLADLLREQGSLSEPQRWNLCREYLQTVLLKLLYQTPSGRELVFQGGACLRMCHNLKRYSEDLDFSRIGKEKGDSFNTLFQTLLAQLKRLGFDASGTARADKVVQKAFVQFGELPQRFGFAMAPTQKLSIKIKVDVRPPRRGKVDSFFVSRFGELFPILKYDLPTLFAGKALALLFRSYERGRDHYDLIWYLGQRTTGNWPYFASGLKQISGPKPDLRNWKDVMSAIGEKVKRVDPKRLAQDLRPFLEDPSDLDWIRRYPQVFEQLARDV
jgi:predicted nucleotidyltransferase component of viral defense system